MIIGSVRKGERKKMLVFLEKIGLDQAALSFIEKRLRRERKIVTIFFNVYTQDDQTRLENLANDGKIKFKKRGNIFFFAKRISCIFQGNNDLLLGIHFPDSTARPGYTNWWEYQI